MRLDSLFSDLHARGLFNGAVVVGIRDRVIFEKGYGSANLEHNVPFTPDTPSDAASIAKTFTAALLIDLDREGVLGLDDPAQKYLPELPYPEITLRHLLSHTSGIPSPYYEYFDPFLPPGEIRTTERLLGVIAKEKPPLRAKPGSAFEYSSFAYDLAALAAARASGKTFGVLLDERFFKPLGMTSAFLRPGRLADFPGVRTMSYRMENGNLVVFDVFEDEAFHGGSNIYLSARDLHRWNASLFSNTAVLRQATIDGHPSALTLGSWYSDGSSYWYPGHLQGFHSVVFRDARRGRSIVYVSNNTIEPWLQHGIIRTISAILDGGSASASPPNTVDVVKTDYASLTGRWKAGEPLEIEHDGRHLFLKRAGVRYLMVQIDRRSFYVPGLDFLIGFGARLWRIHVSTAVRERWGTRITSPSPIANRSSEERSRVPSVR
jgi:CubicO group peptidase (beta-lactamase class C family)